VGGEMKIVPIRKDEDLIKNLATLYCKVFNKINLDEMVVRITRHIGYTDFKGVIAINDKNEIVGFTYGLLLIRRTVL